MYPTLISFRRVRPQPIGWGITLWLLLVLPAMAQRQDPMMQLMMSQPPVDVSSPAVATAAVDPPVVPVGDSPGP